MELAKFGERIAHIDLSAGSVEVLRRGRVALSASLDIANDLAWRLATSAQPELRDGAEAVTLAEQVASIADSQEFCHGNNENPA